VTSLPRGWKWASIGDVADLTDGPFGSNLKTAHYVESGPRVIRLQNIGDGVFRDERAHITQEHYDRLVKHAVAPDDVIVASLGEQAPRACLIPNWIGPAIVKADCIRARPLGGIDSRFLMWMLNSPPVRAQATASIRGIGRPRLGLGGIRRLQIPIAPLAEQRRIVAAIEEHLSRLDAADSSLARLRIALRVMARVAVRDTFDPRWPKKTLAEIGSYWNGRAFKKSEWRETGRPIIRIQNLTGSSGRFNYFAGEVDERNVARKGDLLVSWAATLGAYVWDGPEAVINQHIFKVESRIVRSYHYYALLTTLDDLHRRAHGSGMVHVTRSVFDHATVPVPAEEEQRLAVEEIERRLSLVRSLDDAVVDAQRRSRTLRWAVLRAAFRGELISQDVSNEPATVLLDRIAAERVAAPKPTRKRKAKTSA
jgi:type I restriction enzyme S subunit